MSITIVLLGWITIAAVIEAVVERRRRKRAEKLDLQRRLYQLKG